MVQVGELVVQLHQSRIFGARSTAATGRWLHLKRRTRLVGSGRTGRSVLCCRCCRPQIGLRGGVEMCLQTDTLRE